jgi:NAD(P)-dependent dehydrogenase (short-subunit alcohol dehydrogenase family)
MSKLDGKVAVITGGSSGIGLATAKRLAAEGAYIFITGRRGSELDAAARDIGRNVTAIQSDVSRLTDLDTLFETVKQLKGRIDILFANAGIAESAPLGEITEDHFDRQFDINVKGALFTVQKALPLLSDGASIILTSSIVGSKGFAMRSVYSATKAALRSFARTFASDLKSRRIRVNAVSPGPIDTPGLQALSRTNSEGWRSRTATASRSAASASPTTSRRSSRSSRPMTAHTSRARSSASTVGSGRCDRVGASYHR